MERQEEVKEAAEDAGMASGQVRAASTDRHNLSKVVKRRGRGHASGGGGCGNETGETGLTDRPHAKQAMTNN